MLFRPSLPWGFAAGSGSIFGELPFEDAIFLKGSEGVAGAGAAAAAGGNRRKQEEKVAKIDLFLWVSEVTLGSFGRNFDAFPSFTAMGICCWEWFDFRRLPFEDAFLNRKQEEVAGAGSSSRRQQEETGGKSS